jgi:hypothetical protein
MARSTNTGVIEKKSWTRREALSLVKNFICITTKTLRGICDVTSLAVGLTIFTISRNIECRIWA